MNPRRSYSRRAPSFVVSASSITCKSEHDQIKTPRETHRKGHEILRTCMMCVCETKCRARNGYGVRKKMVGDLHHRVMEWLNKDVTENYAVSVSDPTYGTAGPYQIVKVE